MKPDREMLGQRYDMYTLEAFEKPKKLYEYYVSGTGMFPFDMLRFDHCWPASGNDAALLDDATEYHRSGHRSKLRSIKMRSYREPTIDRWVSFTWSVGTQKLQPSQADE